MIPAPAYIAPPSRPTAAHLAKGAPPCASAPAVIRRLPATRRPLLGPSPFYLIVRSRRKQSLPIFRDERQRQACLVLVLAALVAVAHLADGVGAEEQDLGDALAG